MKKHNPPAGRREDWRDKSRISGARLSSPSRYSLINGDR